MPAPENPVATPDGSLSPAPDRIERLLRPLLGLLLLLVTVVVYRSVVHFELTTWDDDQHITENPYYDPLTWKNVLHFWGYSYIYMYIPVSYNFWALEVWIAEFFPKPDDPLQKFNPAVFHVGNLLLHLGSTLLAYRLLLRFVPVSWAAALGAALFAFHPLQTESVCWVGETRGLLCTFFSFLAWWYHLRSVGIDPQLGILAEQPPPDPPFRRANYAWGFFFFALALLSKPAAASLPLVVLVVDVVLLRRPWKTAIKTLIPWFAAGAVIMGLTKYYQSSSIIYEKSVLPWYQRPLVAGDAYAFYLEKLVWPFDLAFEYARAPYRAAAMPGFAWRWLIPLGVGLALLIGRRRRIWLGAYLIFITGILSVSGIVPFLFQAISTVGDRYMYVPMLGFGLMLAAFIATRKHPIVPVLVATFVLGFCGARSYEQSQTWRNDWTLLANGLRITPESFIAHQTLGNRYRNSGHFDQAIPHYTKSWELRPDFVHPLYLRGVCRLELGREEQALEDFKKAVEISPELFSGWIALGDLHAKRKQWAEAETAYRGAAKAEPENPHAHVVLGALALKRRDPTAATADAEAKAAAEAEFAEAIELDEESSDTFRNIGRAWLDAEHFREGATALERAVELDPKNADAYADLSGCYYQLSKFVPAIQAGRAAVSLDEKLFEAQHNLGLALAAVNKADEARPHLEAALKLAPPGGKQSAEIRRVLDALR
jgi:tetratricopeptide (TPR) repeat protein